MQLQPLRIENMAGEENTDLTLTLQCGEETVPFINPYPKQGSPFSCNTLYETAMTAYHNGQDMVSTPAEGKLEFDFAANCRSVRREISDWNAVSCRGRREESDELIRPETPRKKLRLSKYQSTILEESFKEQFTLSPKLKSALANKLKLQPRQVEVWFQNRRARTKLKQKEVECENLKRCCESLREENRRLEIEVQSLRAKKTEEEDLYAQPPNSMALATASLTVSPSCERLQPTPRPPPSTPSSS